MKRKIIMITACVMSCMLLVCVAPGSYAEMSDEAILDDSDYPVQEEVSEAPAEPESVPETAPVTKEEENPAAEEPEDKAEPAAEDKTEPAPEPEPEPEPEPAPAEEPEPESEPEPADEPAAAEEAEDDPEEPDEDGMYEFDDEDHGFIEPSAMPEELQTVTPEMRFEGITELSIGSEVSGTAAGAPGTYHYIRSASVRPVVLTLYAGTDIQLLVNDRPVTLEPAEDADGNECMSCRVSLREGETYISLIGASVSYRLKAAVPAEKAEEEIRTDEIPAEAADAETGDPAEAAEEPVAEEPAAEESAADEAPAEAETDEEPAEAEAPAIEADEAYIAFDDPEAVMSAYPVEKDKERHVEIHSSIDDLERVYCNSYVKMNAELFGYEGMDCTVQWLYSPDHGATWITIPGANKLKYIYQINEENFHYIWSVKVTPADAEQGNQRV